MKGYLPFRDYLKEKGLWLDWNDGTEEYDVIRTTGYVNVVITSLPAQTVRRDFDAARSQVEAVMTMMDEWGYLLQ